MDYTVKFSAVKFGDTPLLSTVAEAMAHQLTSGGGPDDQSLEAIEQIREGICLRLWNAVVRGKLKACDQFGDNPSPMVRLAPKPADFRTLYVRKKHLVDWGALDGDTFLFHDTDQDAILAKKDLSIALPSNAVELGSDGTAKPTWRHLIQAEAWEHWLRLRASGCNPSVHSICPAMAKWCQVQNIKGEKGQNPAVGTIRNAVLGAGHWVPPHHSVEEAKKYIEQVAQTAQSKVAHI